VKVFDLISADYLMGQAENMRAICARQGLGPDAARMYKTALTQLADFLACRGALLTFDTVQQYSELLRSSFEGSSLRSKRTQLLAVLRLLYGIGELPEDLGFAVDLREGYGQVILTSVHDDYVHTEVYKKLVSYCMERSGNFEVAQKCAMAELTYTYLIPRDVVCHIPTNFVGHQFLRLFGQPGVLTALNTCPCVSMYLDIKGPRDVYAFGQNSEIVAFETDCLLRQLSGNVTFRLEDLVNGRRSELLNSDVPTTWLMRGVYVSPKDYEVLVQREQA